MPKRIYQRKVIYKKGRSKKKKIIVFIIELMILIFLVCFFTGVFLFFYYAKDLPRPEKFTERDFVESTKIFDRKGEILLYELYGEEKREIIPLEEIPEHVKNAAIAVEDAKFYSHRGIDMGGIFRSIKINWQLKRLSVGASTISQQLIRSTFLTPEKTIKRKVREIILTLELERRYEKDQILEWYLNQVPFGPNIYGIESASKTYFLKSAKDLTLNEAATLIAMIQAPSYFSPYGEHRDELIERKNYALDRMVQERYISEKEAELIKEEKVEFTESPQSLKAAHFIFYVKDYLFSKYGQNFLERGGLKIYTSLDWELQQVAEKAIKEGVERNKAYNAHNASLVSMDPKTGEILAMVGSADWFGESYPEDCISGKDCLFDPKLNVATYKLGRQPGSSFKPFVYATAFAEKDIDDKHIVIDEETNFGIFGGKPYIPQNYDGLFRGPVTLRQALAQSLNVPSVKVLAYLAGQEKSIENARKFGITTLNRAPSFYGLSIVLGGGEVRLLDMVTAYSVFATEGLKTTPISILKIEDSEGKTIESFQSTPKRVLDERSSRLINDILSDNQARAPMFGARSSMYFSNYQVAAKTGTTDSYKDAWIIGYTPTIVTGVWAGNNDNTPMSRQPGIVLAGPIWREFMNTGIVKMPKQYFTPLEK